MRAGGGKGGATGNPAPAVPPPPSLHGGNAEAKGAR